MPRLFPHLGRSSKEHVAGRDAYDPYYGHPEHGYGYDSYEYEPKQSERPAWRRMLSKTSGSSSNTKSSGTRTGGRAYYGEGEVPGFQRTVSRTRPTHTPNPGMYAYPGQVPHYTNSDDTESYVNIPSRPRSPVPIVQRESSFTDMNGLGRLQEAFADHGTYTAATPTMTIDPTTPLRGSPRMPLRSMHTAGPVQMGTMHEARHEPVIIDDSNGSVEGIRADVDVMRPSSSKHKRHHAHHERERPPREHKSQRMEVVTGGPTYWEHHPGVHEYPPVVVVVQRGRYGEKDTYYIIPGGQPVVFKDDYGNEITRVGDFSGFYVPQPPHPVIVEDEYGREICRAGFSDGRISPGPHFGRVNVQYLGGDTRGYKRSRSSRREHYDRMYDGEHDRGYDRAYAPSYISYPSPTYDEFADDRPPYRRHGSYDYPDMASSRNVVFADPEASMSGRRPTLSHRSRSNYSGSRRGEERYYDSPPRMDGYGSYGSSGLSYVDADPYVDPYTGRSRSRSGSGSSSSRRYRDVGYDTRY